ncbi:MAG: HlyD family efflux transporter periplasmic adaptor subunit [Candidatus Omnitrophota bacterium]
MNRNNKKRILTLAILVLLPAVLMAAHFLRKKPSPGAAREVAPSLGTVNAVISTTGTVLPKNRLEIKPPVNGRIEKVLVREGEAVKTGRILAWMSSTERAALLDNARGQGPEAVKYWEEAYKPIPLSAPIDGEVIVATTQPGQTVTTQDPVVVLSDHLIVRAQVDETDIGKIRPGQAALITLDAYPETKIKADVEHIYYESETVNNVTVYKVDLKPEKILAFFRSGMNATVDFVEQGKPGALLVPREAVQVSKGLAFVWVSPGPGQEPVQRSVEIGLSDDQHTEILSGLSQDDIVVIKSKTSRSSAAGTSNPFMPGRRR